MGLVAGRMVGWTRGVVAATQVKVKDKCEWCYAFNFSNL